MLTITYEGKTYRLPVEFDLILDLDVFIKEAKDNTKLIGQLEAENEKLLDEGEALKKRLTGGEDMILLPTVDYEKLQTDHANQKRIPERA